MTIVLERLGAALADRYTIAASSGPAARPRCTSPKTSSTIAKMAVKVLRRELAAILGAERFLEEIEVTANLQHPHILALHDSGEADSFLYYVMPYVEGESLRDRLNRPDGRRFLIVREVRGAEEGLGVVLHWFANRSR